MLHLVSLACKEPFAGILFRHNGLEFPALNLGAGHPNLVACAEALFFSWFKIAWVRGLQRCVCLSSLPAFDQCACAQTLKSPAPPSWRRSLQGSLAHSLWAQRVSKAQSCTSPLKKKKKDLENCIETSIISYKKRIASLGLMQDTGCLGLVHWDDPEG